MRRIQLAVLVLLAVLASFLATNVLTAGAVDVARLTQRVDSYDEATNGQQIPCGTTTHVGKVFVHIHPEGFNTALQIVTQPTLVGQSDYLWEDLITATPRSQASYKFGWKGNGVYDFRFGGGETALQHCLITWLRP